MKVTPTSVYRYYDRHAVLIYVGITDRDIRRNLEHNKKAAWWPYVVRQEVDHFESRPEALAREKELIRQFRPPFNTQHNPDSPALREAYLAFVAAGALDDPMVAFRALGAHAPLTVVEQNHELREVVLRTQPTHFAIAQRLLWDRPKGVEPTKVTFGPGAARRVGHVKSMELTAGSLAIITVGIRSADVERVGRVRAGMSGLKVHLQKPVTFRFSYIQLLGYTTPRHDAVEVPSIPRVLVQVERGVA